MKINQPQVCTNTSWTQALNFITELKNALINIEAGISIWLKDINPN